MPPQTQNGRQSLVWWGPLSDGEDRGRLMVEAAKMIWNLPGEMLRRDLDVTNVRMYEQTANASLNDFGGKFFGAGGATGESVQAGSFDPREASTYNVAKQAIDTMASQIFSTDQRARFVTVGGKYQQRRRARRMQALADGLAHEMNLHRLRQRSAMDASVTESGVGALHFFADADKRVTAQRIIPTELAIDPLDGWIDGKPRTIYRKHPVARSWAAAKFGGTNALHGKATDDAIANANAITTSTGHHSDQIEMFEAYRLPTSKDAKDGWHVVAIEHENGTLEVSQFEGKRHRIVMYSVEDRFATPWGNSPFSQVRALQIGLNVDLLRIARSHKLFSAGHLYFDRLAKVKKSAVTNEIGSAWEGNGPTPPSLLKFECATPEQYQEVERKAARIFEQLGINRGSSTGDTSRGPDAPAAAMREETQKTDKRNSVRQQRWEQNHLDCIAAALDVVREIAGKNGTYTVAAPNRTARANNAGLSIVDWRAAALDEDAYILQTHPTSPYPTDPAGLIAFADDMIEKQAWSGKDLARYMNALDAEAQTDYESSQRDLLDETFDALLYERNAVAVPDEFVDYALAIDMGTHYLAMGQREKVPQDRLERVRRYLRKCQKLQRKMQAQQQQAAAPPTTAQPAPTQPVA